MQPNGQWVLCTRYCELHRALLEKQSHIRRSRIILALHFQFQFLIFHWLPMHSFILSIPLSIFLFHSCLTLPTISLHVYRAPSVYLHTSFTLYLSSPPLPPPRPSSSLHLVGSYRHRLRCRPLSSSYFLSPLLLFPLVLSLPVMSSLGHLLSLLSSLVISVCFFLSLLFSLRSSVPLLVTNTQWGVLDRSAFIC